MKDEYGPDIFVDGCPVCKDMCCCSNKSISCLRVNHCYRKCPASKNKAACTAYKEELAHSTLPDGRPPPYVPTDKPNGILDLLAAVADNQLNEQIAAANGKRKYDAEGTSASSSSSSQKSSQPKTDDITSNPAFGFVDTSKIAFLPLPLMGSAESAAGGATGAVPSPFVTSDIFSHYGAFAAGPALALFPAATAAGAYDGLTPRYLPDYLLAAAQGQPATTGEPRGSIAVTPSASSVSPSNAASTAAASASGTATAAAAVAAPTGGVPPLSLFSGPYRTSAPLFVDPATGGYHLYDMNGIDGFVHARGSAPPNAAATALGHPGFAPIGLAAIPGLQYHPLSYAFLTRPMMPPTAGLPGAAPVSGPAAAATTRRIPFAGTEYPPALLSPKSFDVTQRPSPPRTSQGGASLTSIVPESRGETDFLGSAAAAATVGAAAASLASSSSTSSLSQPSSDPINILALVSSYSSTMGNGGSAGGGCNL